MSTTVATHSPAPWTLEHAHTPGYTPRLTVVDAKGVAVANLDGYGTYNPRVLAQVKVDGALLAAAPDLLRVLEDLLEAADGFRDVDTRRLNAAHQEGANLVAAINRQES